MTEIQNSKPFYDLEEGKAESVSVTRSAGACAACWVLEFGIYL